MRGNEKQWQGEARWGRTKQGHGTVTPGNEHTIESKRRDNLRKDILVQYCDLQQEAKDIRKRIEKMQARLNRIQRGGTVLDSVSGTRADGTIGSIWIEGFPFGDFNKQWEHLNRYAESLSAAEAKLLEQAAEVEQYIRTIEDSRMRRIIQYRVIDGLSWYEVADRIGGKATSESCRKYFERFLEKC